MSTEKGGDRFFYDSPFCYCYSLKLAYAFHPENIKLHELIASNMDYDSDYVKPFLLEILCLIAKSMGTESSYFKYLFEEKKPWLMGE